MPEDVILENDIPLQARKDKYDADCKSVLAHKVILAWILKYCTAEFAECSIEDIMDRYIEGTPEVATAVVHRSKKTKALLIDGTNTEDSSVAEGVVTFDVKFLAHAPLNDELIKMVYESTKEEFLNAYDEACQKYLDGKVDKERFKKSYFIEIQSIVKSVENTLCIKKQNRRKVMKIKEWFSIKGVRKEIKNIHWLTKKELAYNSMVVLVFCFLFGLFFYGSDAIIALILKALGMN